jgi:hypothetical protein
MSFPCNVSLGMPDGQPRVSVVRQAMEESFADTRELSAADFFREANDRADLCGSESQRKYAIEEANCLKALSYFFARAIDEGLSLEQITLCHHFA